MAFDQLRVRVEYTTFERPTRIAATVDFSGFASGGRRDVAEYRLEPLPGDGTRVLVSGDSNRGPIPLIGPLIEWLYARRMRRKFAAIA